MDSAAPREDPSLLGGKKWLHALPGGVLFVIFMAALGGWQYFAAVALASAIIWSIRGIVWRAMASRRRWERELAFAFGVLLLSFPIFIALAEFTR